MTFKERFAQLDPERLIVNSSEFRYVPDVGVFCIGWISRAVNIKIIEPDIRSFTRDDIAAMVAEVIPFYDAEERRPFAPLTLQKALLAYERPDGVLRLLDGRKRANQAFHEGRTEVRICVVSLADAIKYGTSEETRQSYKVAEATKYDPIGSETPTFYSVSLAQLSAYKAARGRPQATDMQVSLNYNMYFYVNALIDTEDFIRSNHHEHRLMPEGLKYQSKEHWAEHFFDWFMRRYNLPFHLSYNRVKNNASEAINHVSPLHSRSEFKATSKPSWEDMKVKALLKDRDHTLRITIAVIKAAFRLTLWLESQRSLVTKENRDLPVSLKMVRDDVYHRLGRTVRDKHLEYEASELSLEEKVMVTHITGINMGDVYYDLAEIDPILECYVFSHSFVNNRESVLDLGAIEHIVQRRAMQSAGQTDPMSNIWEGVIYQWSETDIDDDSMMDMLDFCDQAENWSMGSTFGRVFRLDDGRQP